MKYNPTLIRQHLCAMALPVILIGGMTSALPSKTMADVTWYDNKKAPLPRGSLLTNNAGYWGEMTATDLSYSYLEEPTNPPDVLPRDGKGFGNRLLDGQRLGDWHSPVGINGKPLVVDFDFHQRIRLQDVAVSEYQGQDLRLAQIEVRDGLEDAWKKVYSTTASAGPLHRMLLSEPVEARYVRLTVQSKGNITYISQVWMWGQAQTVRASKQTNGFWPEINDFPATQNAKPGDGTVLSAARLAAWRRKTGFRGKGVVWQVAPTWQLLKKDLLAGDFLPGKAALHQPVEIKLARNEGAGAAVYLVNASDAPQKLTVQLSPFKDKQGKAAPGIKSELYVAGSIWTRRWGQALRPLFTASNKLGGNLMEKYLTNGSVVKDFPVLHLPPGGTVLLWVSVETNGATAGSYHATVSDGTQSIPIQMLVQPITLPTPERWVRYWGNEPASLVGLWFDDAAVKREMEYQVGLGASVWPIWPENDNYTEAARTFLKSKHDREAHFVVGIPDDMQAQGYNGKLDPEKFDEAFKKRLRDGTLKLVEKAKTLGIAYKDWSVELWDEPTVNNMKSWVALARLIKQADPKVQIYMNPLFWTREGTNPAGFVTDERQVKELGDWYNELVDISVPIQGQTNSAAYPEANRLFYNHLPRKVRAYFTHPNPGRNLSWEAFIRGYNGWGSYAYFAARKDPWNDFDHPEVDYIIVYPGPHGFIPTIESESMRESWEDYRWLTLLQQQGKHEALKNITRIYKSGLIEIPSQETMEDRDRRGMKADEKLPYLHDMAMRAALK